MFKSEYFQLITVNFIAEAINQNFASISITGYGPPLNAAFSKWPSSQINCPHLS